MLPVSISVKGMYEQWKSDSVVQTHASSNIWDTLGLLTWHSHANPEILAFLGYHIWQDCKFSSVWNDMESFVQPVESRPVCVFHHLSSPGKKNQLYDLLIRDTPFKCFNILESCLYEFYMVCGAQTWKQWCPSTFMPHSSLGCQIIARSPGDKYNYVVAP